MANLPSDIYAGGAVPFNFTPFAQFYVQAQARKQAKIDAMDNYFRQLGSTLTPAGMASNDVPDFTNKVNDWNKFVAQNKTILANPRHKDYAQAITQEQQLYNDALGLSEASKNKVKDIYQAKTLIKPDHPFTDASLLAMHNASLPVSQGYQPMDFSLLQYDDKADAKDLKAYEDFAKNGMQMSEQQPTITIDPETKKEIVTTKSTYLPSDLNTIANRATMLYHTDPKFSRIVDDLAKSPENYNSLNQKFKNVYGHDLDIQHPEEFAAALLLGQTEKVDTKANNSQAEEWKHQEKMEAIRNANTNARLSTAEKLRENFERFKRSGNKGDQESTIGNIINQQTNKSINPLQFTFKDGTKIKGHPISIPSSLAYNYTKRTSADNQSYSAPEGGYYISDDNKYLIPIFKSDKNGSISTQKSELIPIVNYKADLAHWLLSKKDAGEELNDDDFTGIADEDNITIPETSTKRPPLGSFVKQK